MRQLFSEHFPTFWYCRNVGNTSFTDLRDMHWRDDEIFFEKKGRAASMEKETWKRRNGNLAERIFGEIEADFDKNAEMQVDFVG